MKFSFLASLVALPVCMAACEKTVYTRGCAMDFSDFRKIRIGKDNARGGTTGFTCQSVLKKMGSWMLRC